MTKVGLFLPTSAVACNHGWGWPVCRRAIADVRPCFRPPSDFVSGWPTDGPPVAAIADWPDVPPPFDRRLYVLVESLARATANSLAELRSRHPNLRLSLTLATSHNEPGPVTTLVEAGSYDSTVAPAVWSALMSDRLVSAACAGLGMNLPAHTVSAACASALVALGQARERILAGMVDVVVIIAADSLSRIAYTGFRRIGALSQTACRPFDANRDGTTIGEGGAVLVALRTDLVTADELMATVDGFATNCDARHLVEPSVDGLEEVLHGALGAMAPEKVGGVFWHGTGTRQNDATEAEAARRVFGTAIPPGTSVKGIFGHTMGASSAFSILAAGDALASGFVPVVAGLERPDFTDLNLVKDNPLPLRSPSALVVALGFGGVNAALQLSVCGNRSC